MKPEKFDPRGLIGGIILGILISGVIISIAVFVTLRIPVALNGPPVNYLNVDITIPDAVCPGAVLTGTMQVRINNPGVTQTYTAIRDKSTGRNVIGTLGEVGVRIQPEPFEASAPFSITVPVNLPPGNYEYVRAAVAINMDAQPSFLTLPFRVKACP